MGDMDNQQRVTITAKVLRVATPRQVNGGQRKQDVYLADATAAAQVTLWEEDVNLLHENVSYHFFNIQRQDYRGQKYLELGRYQWEVEEVDDI